MFASIRIQVGHFARRQSIRCDHPRRLLPPVPVTSGRSFCSVKDDSQKNSNNNQSETAETSEGKKSASDTASVRSTEPSSINSSRQSPLTVQKNIAAESSKQVQEREEQRMKPGTSFRGSVHSVAALHDMEDEELEDYLAGLTAEDRTETLRLMELAQRLNTRRAQIEEANEVSESDRKITFYEGQKQERRSIVRAGALFREIPKDERDKETFHKALGLFLQNNSQRRGYVEFIYAALKWMKEFGVEKDVETYKALVNIFPKGKLIPPNQITAEFGHYIREQECCVDVIDELEYQSVQMDKELFDLVLNTFGEYGEPGKKVMRLAYWQPKFKNLNPFPMPRILPADGREVAVMAIKRMCIDPATVISEHITKAEHDEGDASAGRKEWIVSGMSPHQIRHVQQHPSEKPLYVDGPFRVWVRYLQVNYFTLTAEPNPNKQWIQFHKSQAENEADEQPETWKKWTHDYNTEWSERRRALLATPSMHEQPDQTVLAIGATSSSTKESAGRWIDSIAKQVPRLQELQVVFRMYHAQTDLAHPKPDTDRDVATAKTI